MHTGLHCSEVGACHGSKHSTESTDMHVRASRAEREGEEEEEEEDEDEEEEEEEEGSEGKAKEGGGERKESERRIC